MVPFCVCLDYVVCCHQSVGTCQVGLHIVALLASKPVWACSFISIFEISKALSFMCFQCHRSINVVSWLKPMITSCCRFDCILMLCLEPSRSVIFPIVLDPYCIVGQDVVQPMGAHAHVLMMKNVFQGDKLHCFGRNHQPLCPRLLQG